MEEKIRAALYVRVSTASKTKQADTAKFIQNPDVQEQPIPDLVAQRGWTIYRVFSDRASGARERRPGLDALMADARRGMFDVVVVWRFDRFARSVKQLVLTLEEFKSLGIEFVSHQEALDTSTPMGKAMFTIVAAIAELERSLIRERSVNLGVAAHISGAAVGGPRYDATITPAQRASIKNGVWLCQTCAKRIDADEQRYTVAVLASWKKGVENEAHQRLGKARARPSTSSTSLNGPYSSAMRCEGIS
jgi:DNA invertase Pin-like site-specific DNA recombinase